MENPVAVVTGASGFIGTRLVRRLIREQGSPKVRAIDLLPPREVHERVEYITADVRQPLRAEIARGADVIYNLAAVHRTPGHPPHEYYEGNVWGAINVTRLAESAGVRNIVFTSSIAVYGPSEEPLVEDSELRPTSSYGRSKLMAEAIHEQWCERHSDSRLIIVRPGVIFGPGEGGNYSNLARALRRGYFAFPGRRETIKSGGYVDDLLLSIEFARKRRERHIVFNYVDPAENTIEDIVRILSEVAGYRSRYPTVPLNLVVAAAYAFEIANVLGLRTTIHRERVTKLVNSTRVFPAWLTKHGFNFTYDLRKGLSAWREETSGRFD